MDATKLYTLQTPTQAQLITILFHSTTKNYPTALQIALSPENNIKLMTPPSTPTRPNRTQLPPTTDPITFALHNPTTLAIHGGCGTWFTALHWAVVMDDRALLEMALAGGTVVDLRDYYGYTALHIAVLKSDAVSVRVLLEWQANVEAKANVNGRTPLDEARRIWKSKLSDKGEEGCSSLEIVWLLLENGNDRDWRDGCGTPLLHLAVLFRHVVLVRDLLDTGGEEGTVNMRVVGCDGKVGVRAATGRVDVNVKDREGQTALHVARKVGDWDLVRFLLEMGVDPLIKDRYGKIAIEY